MSVGNTNAQTITMEVEVDFFGYEVYWEATPEGDPCGTNTIISGGNTVVGCAGQGVQVAAGTDPGAYAANSLNGPFVLGTAPLDVDIHHVDDFDDGTATFYFYADGVLINTVASSGIGGPQVITQNFTAGVPGCTDGDAINFTAAATIDDGSCIVPTCDLVDDETPIAPSEGESAFCYPTGVTTGFQYDAASPTDNVAITFTSGEMEGCCDAVNIYEGTDNTGVLLDSQTGNLTGLTVETLGPGNSMFVEFTSDGSVSCESGSFGTASWDVYCAVAVVPGCQDEDALNYDPAATVDNGSCIVPSCDTVDDGVPVAPSLAGESACYGAGTTELTYAADPGEQVTVFINSGEVEGFFDTFTIYDGLDNTAPILVGPVDGNLSGITATATSGNITLEWVGDATSGDCADATFAATVFDVYCGSFAGILGCTDGDAVNFDPAATADDGSCVIPSCDTTDDDTAIAPTNSGTFCYDNAVTSTILFTADTPGETVSVSIASGVVEAGFDELFVYEGTDNTGTLIAGPLDGDLSGEAFEGVDNLFFEIVADAIFSCASGEIEILTFDVYCGNGDTGPGCTDPTAFNFDPFASSDDGSCIAPPANDTPAGAIDVACGSVTAGSSLNSTDSEGLVGTTCTEPVTGPGVWYRFNGTGDLVTISTCDDADYDSKIIVYTSAIGDGSDLACLTGNDDGAGCGGFTSELVITSNPGTIYFIYVTGFGTETGNFNLTVSCDPDPCFGITPPSNDVCTAGSILPLFSGVPVTEDLCCTTPEPFDNPTTFNSTFGVWYVFDNTAGSFNGLSLTVTNTGPAGSFAGATIYEVIDPLVDICDPTNSTYIGGCPPVGVECSTGNTPFDNINNSLYIINLNTTDPFDFCGTAELLVVGEVFGCIDPSADNFDPLATSDDGTCTYSSIPPNDECATAALVDCTNNGGAGYTGSTGGSTATGSPTACGPAGATGVWYSFVGTGDIVTVSTCGSVIDSRLAILEGPCGAPTACIDAVDDGGCDFFNGDDASITFTSTVGTQYYFFVSGFGGEEGAFVLDVECAPITPGCTNPNAVNFDPLANQDDGSCSFEDLDACGDSYEICYANDDTQVYTYATPNVGTDAVTITFGTNSVIEAGFDVINIYDGFDNTGTLLFSGDGDISGLSFGAQSGAISVEIIADGSNDCAGGVFILGVNFDITCAPLVFGCTNPDATNFDSLANVDDGSCEFCGETITYCYGNNEDYQLVLNAPAGELIELDIVQGLFETTFDSFTVYDGGSIAAPVLFTGDGDVSGNQILSSGNQLTIQILSDISNSCAGGGLPLNSSLIVDVACGLAGCDNPIACNFDAAAVFLDCGLCEYASCVGCSYPNAINYGGASITLDDGSCTFPTGGSCPEDINGDNVINTGDLTSLLGEFGNTCP